MGYTITIQFIYIIRVQVNKSGFGGKILKMFSFSLQNAVAGPIK